VGHVNAAEQGEIPEDLGPQNQCCGNLKSQTQIKINIEEEYSFKEELYTRLNIHDQNFNTRANVDACTHTH
jgi:hypothetical protein